MFHISYFRVTSARGTGKGWGREELKKGSVQPCVKDFKQNSALFQGNTSLLRALGLLWIASILVFQLFILSPATVCDSVPGWVTRTSHGQTKNDPSCLQTLYSELCTAEFIPLIQSSRCLLPLHPAPAPADLLRIASRAGSSLTSNPRLRNHPVLHSSSPLLFAPQVKPTLFMGHGTLWPDLLGQEQEILEKAGHRTHTYRWQFGNVFFVSASVTYAVSSLFSPLGTTTCCPFP